MSSWLEWDDEDYDGEEEQPSEMHIAAKEGNIELLRKLVKNGGNVDEIFDKYTPLMIALKKPDPYASPHPVRSTTGPLKIPANKVSVHH